MLNIKIIRTKEIILTFLIILICVILFSNVFATSYIYKQNVNKQINSSSVAVVNKPEFAFQSKSQILMEPTTGNIIYANNENERISPASVTKIMSLLLIMEQIDSGKINYTDYVTCSTNASKMGGSQIWFKENEKLTIDEALKAICVVSANDVTVAMAELIGGSEENFVNMMNEKAKQLDMTNTNFINSHGIDEDNHYTSALDIAIMSRELITKHPNVLKYTSIWMDTLRNGTFNLSSTNKLIRFYEGATGLKTGSTSKALFNLSGTATKNNTTFIAVVCTAPNSDIRLQETKQLLDYGFNNYKTEKVFDKDQEVDKVVIEKKIDEEYSLIVKEEISVLTEKGRKIEWDTNIILKELKAPINKEESVGKINIIDKQGNVISEKEIYITENVLKTNIMEYFMHIVKKIAIT